jgi:hypothetical protein
MSKWLVEQVGGDDDDVDQYGMDALTRKRLNVKTKAERIKGKKVLKPMRSRLPHSLAKVESRLRDRGYLAEGLSKQRYNPGAIQRIMDKYNLKPIITHIKKTCGNRIGLKEAAELLYEYLKGSYKQPPEEMGREIFGDAVGGCIHEMLGACDY